MLDGPGGGTASPSPSPAGGVQNPFDPNSLDQGTGPYSRLDRLPVEAGIGAGTLVEGIGVERILHAARRRGGGGRGGRGRRGEDPNNPYSDLAGMLDGPGGGTASPSPSPAGSGT
jgi:hypothetical protein